MAVLRALKMAALFGFDSDSSDSSSDERPVGPVSARSAVTADTWKGQLDFDRPCSGPERRCWLCTKLTPWNRAMHGLAFELIERRPGKLQLRSMPHGDGDVEKDRATAAAEASFLVSWLLQHHPCIDELKVDYEDHPGRGDKETPFAIRLRPTTGSDSRRIVRGLELEGSAMSWSSKQRHCYELEDLDAVGGLESLKLDFNKIKSKVAAELAKLLRRNAGSIKRLEISNPKVPRLFNKALRYLFSCESLSISCGYDEWRGRPVSMVSLARLLHSSTALKELTVAKIESREQMSALANELETNTTLKKAQHSGSRLLSGASVHRASAQHYVGRAADVEIYRPSLHLLAAALKVNTTLESLKLSSEIPLPADGIAALCKALRTNKTLKKLVFIDVKWRQSFSDALARQLTRDDCYSRVELPWTEPDLPGLTAALTSSLAAIEEFRLPDIRGLSLASLEQLFDALASSKCVRTLGVHIKGDPGKKGRALCEMLKANRTIDCLDLGIDKDNGKFVGEILHALAENTGITKMLVGIDEVREFETATSLSYLLAHNKTATKFSFSTMTSLYFEFVEEFSRGMQQNKTIVKFGLATNLLCDAASFPFFEAVRRNQGALNRAVDFVVSPSLDRQCAEGFECFSGRPCLRKLLKKVTGKTEPEALLAISAAERYLRDNYLLITGIVRHSVECHPAKTTQVDALNKDCWLAIVRHLRVADVLA
ncbi:hypothetical protein HPB48_017929 [Haemaphysalis longicornis]|uniref:Uncharacterized protein n=1 Tax=Haemaphysalis longicornis TaxID=44386 RepID=A0A9J6GNG9_HAELO|nr:hypothetical protein HPB48_017929 [Haemaphysalis longicornis]